MKQTKPANGSTEKALVMRDIPIDKETVEATGIWAIVQHNANLMALVEKLIEHQTASFADQVTERQNMMLILNEFAKTHIENIKDRESMLDKKQERRLKLEKERQQMQLMGGLASELKVLIPHIANKLAGRKPLSQDEKNELRNFVSELSTAELEGLEKALPPAKSAVLARLIRSVLTDDETKEVDEEKPPETQRQPKDDSDGEDDSC